MKNKTNFIIYSLAILGMFLMLTSGCKKDDNSPTPINNLPVLTTTDVRNIWYTEAGIGGMIISDGGSPIILYGVCLSSTNLPTINDPRTYYYGTHIGSYRDSLTHLTHSTTYYVRAYATNKNGTGYGNVLSFTTPTYPPGGLNISACDPDQTNYYGGVDVFLYKTDEDRTNDITRTKYYLKSTTDKVDPMNVGAIFNDLFVAEYFAFCKWTDGSQTLTGTCDIWVESMYTKRGVAILQ